MNKDKTKISNYYDTFSNFYDLFSSKAYYRIPREFAIKELSLDLNQTILNVPCGTGQNFEYFENYLNNTGQIIAVDLSEGMLEKAHIKVKKYKWKNIELMKEDVTKIDVDWVQCKLGNNLQFDAIFCDLGLSGFPQWEEVIDNLISLLKPNGKIVIMDWYIDKPSLRGSFIKWIGKGEVDRPLYQYLEKRVCNFKLMLPLSYPNPHTLLFFIITVCLLL